MTAFAARLVTYSQAIQFLYSLRWYGTKHGLDNAFRLAGLAGNPHHGCDSFMWPARTAKGPPAP
jgi:hypothetical protein